MIEKETIEVDEFLSRINNMFINRCILSQFGKEFYGDITLFFEKGKFIHAGYHGTLKL